VTGSKFYGMIPDGRPFTIDLLKQEKKAGISLPGDIVVRINRPAKIPLRTKYDWSYSIEPIDGGIIYTNSDFLYRAPTSGYESKYEFIMSATNSHWMPGVRGEQFYIKSRNGHDYGGLVVEVIPDYNDRSVFKVDYTVNPASSGNLEPKN
jgi:hypothetical protein